MKKAVVNIKKWELSIYKGQYSLSGFVVDHLRGYGHIRHTSRMEKYFIDNDILTYETKNTIYSCPLQYMKISPYGHIISTYKEELSNKPEEDYNDLDRIIAVSAKLSIEAGVLDHYNSLYDDEIPKIDFLDEEFLDHVRQIVTGYIQKEKERLIAIVKEHENSIYIELSDIGCGDWLAYNLDSKTGIIEPELHVGTFQDSVIYRQYTSPVLDFRYYPMGANDYVETYKWSDNISNAVIKNVTPYVVIFNEEIIESGETRAFTSEVHNREIFTW